MNAPAWVGADLQRLAGDAEENMNKHLNSMLIVSAAGLGWLTTALAHSPLLDCFVEGDAVKCEAGFSDGTSAAGKKLSVLNASHKLLMEAVLDKSGTYSFKAPAGDYQVVFDGGDNHQATIYSTEIK
jgi:hypothetical protein